MGLFSRERREQHQDWRSDTAFVLYGAPPLEHAPTFGKGSDRAIGLLIRGDGGRQVTVRAKHQADTWLVPGMDVAVRVDPQDAEHVEIDWAALPSIESRVAAGDPVLVDPIGAELRVSEARRLPASGRADRLKQALAAAAAEPALPGRIRGVALVATIRGRSWMDQGTHATSYVNDSAAVLSINVPGRAPYAVLVTKFKCPRGKEAAVDQELPALIAGNDPDDIEILWGEVRSDMDFGAATVAETLAGREASITDRLSQLGGPTGGGFSSAAFDPDRMAAQRAASIQATLARVQDPATRRVMIDQYRAMGIDVGDDGTVR